MPAPEIPDERLAKFAQWAIARMARSDRAPVAERILGAAGQRVQDPRVRADILIDGAEARLARGHVPRHLTKAYVARLERADQEHAAGRWAAAGSETTRALLLAYHRVLHVDGLTSPLAEHPGRYTGPLRKSRAAAALRRPRGRSGTAAAPPPGRPQRLLFVHHDNDNFLRPIQERYEANPDVETRVLDTAHDPVVGPLAKGVTRIVQRALGGQVAYGKDLEAALRPHLDWADTVFIDWCQMGAALFTLVDPGSTRIVVRLHSYEAFSLWPHVVDFSRVDDLVFVSEHLRDLCIAAVPRLKEKGAPRLHVVDNAVELSPFDLPKKPDARFTLGLVGVGQVAKDPRWALEVLRLLREKDDRYRLHLIGSPLDPGVGPAAARYHKVYARELRRLEAAGAVRHIGQTPDVPGALAEIGVILSSSVRESWHLGLVEGAASGAVPVVRDWPFFAGRPRGAKALFPESWVVPDPAAAAERILELTASEDGWRTAGRQAAEHARAAWDWSRVQRDFDRLLLPAGSAVCSTGEAPAEGEEPAEQPAAALPAEALGKAAE
ncbi:glycosyltransferase family 4 protein [Streptomyces sp. HUAS MG47]|uniref:glycosyltransferase family 4 protein n=1 Tax=Streptomyces solicamelliae TaxID=3231716 RepID=UPI003877DD0C